MTNHSDAMEAFAAQLFTPAPQSDFVKKLTTGAEPLDPQTPGLRQKHRTAERNAQANFHEQVRELLTSKTQRYTGTL